MQSFFYALRLFWTLLVACCPECFVKALFSTIGGVMMLRLEWLYRTLLAVPIRCDWVRD